MFPVTQPARFTAIAIVTATALATACTPGIDDADVFESPASDAAPESDPAATGAPVTEAPAGDAPTSAPEVTVATTAAPVETEPGDTEAPASEEADEPAPSVPGTPGAGDLDGAWSTVGTEIVDGDGDVVQIRGVNWFGFETQNGFPHGLWQRGLDDMLDQIADLGFNTIRLPFSAAMLDDDAPVSGIDVNTNPDLDGLTSIEVMDAVIERAGERGLAIVLDRHALSDDNRHHLWYDDQFGPERLVEDWELLAARYGDAPNVIGADLYNEPHDEACWGCGDEAVDWKLAAEEASNALHAVEPEWLVFVEGVEHVEGAECGTTANEGADVPECGWWGGNLADAIDEPIEIAAADKVVYSPHEYATSVFRQAWFDDPSFPDNMEAIWGEFWGDIEIDGHAPVMVGELGTTLDAEVDQVWLTTLLEYLDTNDIGFTYWSWNPNSGDTGGILNDDWESVDTDKYDLLAPYLVGPFAPVSS